MMRTPPGFRDVQADQRWVIEQPATMVANLQLSGANGTQSAPPVATGCDFVEPQRWAIGKGTLR